MEEEAIEHECQGQVRVYYADASIEDLDDLYWRMIRRPWSEVFRAT